MSSDATVLKCLAVDDEPHALKLLQLYIDKTPFLELTFSTTSPWEALTILKEGKIDLAFLDIQMEELTGLQLLGLAGQTCPIILTTAYSEYALDGYEYQVADYLLKPFSFERFLKAVDQIYANKQAASTNQPQIIAAPKKVDHLFIKGDAKNKYHRLAVNDIFYIEGLRNYVQFVCKDQKITTLQNMKSLEASLPTTDFIRIHKSYIVNLQQIQQIDGNSVLVNGQRLSIGQTYRADFFKRIER